MASASIPKTARALMLEPSTGKITFLKDHHVPTPAQNSTEHLIQVHTVALCARENTWPVNFPVDSPTKEYVPGYDVAGTVVQSPASSPFQPGSEVYTRTNYVRTANARDYTIVPTEELSFRPKNLTWEETAATALSAFTAWQGLFVHGGLSSEGFDEGGRENGKRVLITAASGSVGAWVVQFAKLAGAEVVATCGTDNVEYVKILGADQLVDYKTTNLKKWVEAEESRKVDLVFDVLGGQTLKECWSCVKDGGRLISIFQPPEQMRPAENIDKDITSLFFIMESNGKQLTQITKLIEAGKCKPTVDSVWKLEEFEKAFQRVDSGHARGKVVLKLRD